jgi:DNA invertase Pin-like site-specific DNA recombinase
MTTGARPKAYSYIRFSTPEQAKGDSLRRQTEDAQRYAEANELELDTELTFQDLGVSAHRGANVETGRLGEFLAAVKDGPIAPGSFLLVESLDRISRNRPRAALRVLEDICDAGVTVVTTADGKRYDRETIDKDGMALMWALMVAIRANEESERKADRLGKKYAQKRRDAAEGNNTDKPFTRMLPAWLRWNDTAKTHELIPERAAVVRSIFEKADADWGQHRIAQWLNEQRIPTWGGHGNQRKAECWHRSYVKKLLTTSAVIGTFTPHQKRSDGGKRVRKPLDPIEGYFPAVVDRELFERISSRVRAPAARGRNASTEPASIFAGVSRCVHCGGFVTRVSKGENVYLVCSRANRRGTKACRYLAVRYEDVESALRQNAATILREAPRGKGTEEMEAEIARLDQEFSIVADQARDIADELLFEKSSTLRQRLRDKETELESIQERLRGLREKRQALAAPYVLRRLRALRDALKGKRFNVSAVNKTLKETVSKIVIDPEAGTFDIFWQHAPERPTEGVRFFSRHTEFYKSSKTWPAPRRKDKHAASTEGGQQT